MALENSTSSVGVTEAVASGSAVPTSDPSNLASTDAYANKSNSPNLQNDDPEWDLGDGKKAKRSEFLKRQKDFEKGFYKAAQSKAQVEQKFNALSQSLKKFGITAEEFLQNPDEHMSRAAQDLISRQVDESLMDPKEREMSARERALEEREAKQKAYDEKQEATAREERVGSHIEQITQEWAPALKSSGLPANPMTVKRMANVMKAGLSKGIKLDAAECAQYVSEQLRAEHEWGQSFEPKDQASFLARLTPEQKEWVRQDLLNQHKQAAPKPKPIVDTPRANDGKYIGWGEYAKTRRI